MEIINLIREGKLGAAYILARYFYKIGQPKIDDAMYDRLEKTIKEKAYDQYKEYLTRTYDDDPVPVQLLDYIGVKPVFGALNKDRLDLYGYLNEEKSFSIESVTSYEEAYTFFLKLVENQLDFVVSLKLDGVNTKMLYMNDKFALSLSRGRSSDSLDFTDNSARILPQTLNTGKDILRVTGESYVVNEGLPVLRKKYDKDDGFVSGKSAAVSLLRVSYDTEDYQFIKTKVFFAEGLDDTLTGTFEKLKDNGFDTVPYKKISWKDIPIEKEKFNSWLKAEVFDYLADEGKGIPSDGVVVEVDDLNWVGEVHNQYVSRQLALKFEQWSYQLYKGVITNILVEQRRVNKSIRIEIEPLTTVDGCKAAVINGFTPAILIANDYCVGSTVPFERNSNAYNNVVYGKRLEELLAEEKSD